MDAGLVISGISAVAAGTSGWYAWRSTKIARRAALTAEQAAAAADRSASAAERSAAADELAAQLDHQRRHEELTPQLLFELEESHRRSRVYHLKVRLAGPPGLDRLDTLTVSIDDESRFRTRLQRDRLTAPTDEEFEAQIWSRLAFLDDAGSLNRTVSSAALAVGEWLTIPLGPTRTPSWTGQTQEKWSDQFSVIRITAQCSRAGWDTWLLRTEVDLPHSPRVTVF